MTTTQRPVKITATGTAQVLTLTRIITEQGISLTSYALTNRSLFHRASLTVTAHVSDKQFTALCALDDRYSPYGELFDMTGYAA
jgi:hypothetical protein